MHKLLIPIGCLALASGLWWTLGSTSPTSNQEDARSDASRDTVHTRAVRRPALRLRSAKAQGPSPSTAETTEPLELPDFIESERFDSAEAERSYLQSQLEAARRRHDARAKVLDQADDKRARLEESRSSQRVLAVFEQRLQSARQMAELERRTVAHLQQRLDELPL